MSYKGIFKSVMFRYPTRVFTLLSHVEAGRRKMIYHDILVNKEECLEDMGKKDSSLKAFLALVEESIGNVTDGLHTCHALCVRTLLSHPTRGT